MRVLIEIKEHKVRFVKTIVLQLMLMGMGILSGIVGPTLLDLRQQVQTDLKTISYVLTARAGGHGIGSIISELKAYDNNEK